MIKELIAKQIFDSIKQRLEAAPASERPSVIAHEVTTEVLPRIENATNSEPLWKSRIMRGAMLAVAGVIAGYFGISFTEGDLQSIINAVSGIAEAAGILYVIYGRVFASAKKPPVI